MHEAGNREKVSPRPSASMVTPTTGDPDATTIRATEGRSGLDLDGTSGGRVHSWIARDGHHRSVPLERCIEPGKIRLRAHTLEDRPCLRRRLGSGRMCWSDEQDELETGPGPRPREPQFTPPRAGIPVASH